MNLQGTTFIKTIAEMAVVFCCKTTHFIRGKIFDNIIDML
jgi:hypothetical protein